MKKKAVRLAIIGIVITGFIIVKQSGYLHEANIDKLRSFLHGYGPLAPLVYVILISITSNLFIPLSVFIITGGLLFGAIYGFLYSMIGATLSVAIGHIIFNKFKLKQSKYFNERLTRLLQTIQKRSLLTVIIIRLIGIPFTTQNFIGAALDIPFRSYFAGSIIGMTPWVIGFSFFGDSIVRMKYHIIIVSGLLLLVLYWAAFRLGKSRIY